MADILEEGMKAKAKGIKTPKETETISGPGKNTSNRYATKPQGKQK